MSRYAERTSVSVEKSKAEIEALLSRYGASQFVSGWDASAAMIGFRLADRLIKFRLPLPSKDERRFKLTSGGRRTRSQPEQFQAWEQACRQSWRALALAIKAKLEAVAAGIATVEQEFLAYTVLPNKQTVGDWLGPQLAAAYESGKMPMSLPMLEDLR